MIKKLLFRVNYALWHILVAVSKSDRLYTFKLPGGMRFEYPLSSAIGKCLFAGSFEPAETEYIRQHLRSGDVVLDLGANAGLYTVIAARAVGDTGHVYAFEPDARALQLLHRNIAINQLKNVTVIDAAVSNETGEASFAVAKDTALSSLADIGREDQEIAGWRTVNTIRVDDAIKRFRIPTVKFIKMDVEGAEKLALDGASALLSETSAPLTILFEAFDENTRAFGYSVAELLASLRRRGFNLYGFDRWLRLQPVEHLGDEVGKTVYNFVARKNERH